MLSASFATCLTKDRIDMLRSWKVQLYVTQVLFCQCLSHHLNFFGCDNISISNHLFHSLSYFLLTHSTPVLSQPHSENAAVSMKSKSFIPAVGDFQPSYGSTCFIYIFTVFIQTHTHPHTNTHTRTHAHANTLMFIAYLKCFIYNYAQAISCKHVNFFYFRAIISTD